MRITYHLVRPLAAALALFLVLATPNHSNAQETAEFNFYANREGWEPFGYPGFSSPVFDNTFTGRGTLDMTATDNTNQVGIWQSPGFEVVAPGSVATRTDTQQLIGELGSTVFAATFRVMTDEEEPTRVPQIRLRTTSGTGGKSEVLSIESHYDGKYSPTPNARDYTLVFQPSANDSVFQCYFDLLNFYPQDSATAKVMLDRVEVKPLAETLMDGARSERVYDFIDGQDGWESFTMPGAFAEPTFAYDSANGRLGIGISEAEDFQFGFWGSSLDPENNPTIEPNRLYWAVFTVGTDIEDPPLVPEFRLRLNESLFRASQYTNIAATGTAAIVPTFWDSKQYTVFFPPNIGVGENLLCSFDLLANPSRQWLDVGRSIYVERVEVFSRLAQPPETKIENPGFGAAVRELGASVSLDGDTFIAGAPLSASAKVYRRDDQGVWELEADLEMPRASTRGGFGSSVSISGDTAVIANPGQASVFVRKEGKWTEQGRLEAPELRPDDLFATSVAISGDTIAVGIPYDDDYGMNSGSVRVFTRSGEEWTEAARLSASDGFWYERFGHSISISGDTMIVGAPGDLVWGSGSNSAYVFVRSDGEWTEQAKLTASDEEADDNFGWSVSVSGDTAVVGANLDSDNCEDCGSAYVFVRTGTDWKEYAKLSASDAEPNDLFGTSVSISNQTIVVGAHGERDGDVRPGSAYVFSKTEGDWMEQAKLRSSSDGTEGFVTAVSISGDAIVAGASGIDDPRADDSAVYVFGRSGDEWSQQVKFLGATLAAGGLFGYSVSISGDTAIVGAPYFTAGEYLFAGSAHIYGRGPNGIWTQQALLEGLDERGGFGYSVSLSGDTALIGSESLDAAYVFSRSGDVWTEQAKLVPSDIDQESEFGLSVSISGNTAIVGAPIPSHDEDQSGAAYIFVLSDGTWKEEAKLMVEGATPESRFGASTSISEDIAIVGTGGPFVGAYIFARDNGVWAQEAKSIIYEEEFLELAPGVSVSGNTAVVGKGPFSCDGLGLASVMVRSAGIWTEEAVLGIQYGCTDSTAISISGEIIAVGDGWGGSASIFKRSGGIWREQAILLPSGGGRSYDSAQALSVSGNRAIIGAPYAYGPEGYESVAYIFDIIPATGIDEWETFDP
ncbi:FG-GAP repeat protein [bacterium]|nr:FG-GAP repeat protein [bacterium]